MTKNSEYQLRFKRRKKEEAIALFGSRCQICGYSKCMGALEFHHLDPSKKEMNIGFALTQFTWEKIKPELDKCILICSNCHREIHYNHVSDYEIQHLYKPWLKLTCPVCKKVFDTKNNNQIYCSSSCRTFADRKTVRPTKEELKYLIETTSWVQIGRMFNVTDNAIRKWAKQYSLI